MYHLISLRLETNCLIGASGLHKKQEVKMCIKSDQVCADYPLQDQGKELGLAFHSSNKQKFQANQGL